MALDLEAIRRKVKQLNGDKGGVKIWKGTKKEGEHLIRILPWKDAPEGTPFKERWVYYNIGKNWMVSPQSFGKTDPIQEFQNTLWQGDKEDKELAKKLWPRLSTCAVIIDRAAEDEGPQLFIMNNKEAAAVLDKFLDADYGDITHLTEGFDLKVKVVKTKKMFRDKPVLEATIECKPRPSPASTDKEKLSQWLENLPDIDSYYKPMSYEQVKAQFDEWVNTGGPAKLMSGDNGKETERGAEATDSVDELAKEVNSSKEELKAETKAEHKEEPKKARAKKGEKEHATVDAALDDALADLEDDIN